MAVLPPLTLRLTKGTPLTAAEGDTNWKTLRNAVNALYRLFGVSLNDDGTLKNPPIVYGASVAGSDTYVITPVPAVTSMTSLLGRLIALKVDVANTGPATLNISGLGASPILKFKNQALETNDFKAGQVIVLSWDGSNFQMQSQPGIVQPAPYMVDTGTANAIVVATDAAGINSFPAAIAAGYWVRVKLLNSVTGATTAQIGSITAKTVKKNATSDLTTGDALAGQIVDLVYDGTYFQLLGAANDGVQFGTQLTPDQAIADTVPGDPNYQTLSFSHSIGTIPSYVHVVLKCVTGEYGYAAGEEVPIHCIGWSITRPSVSASSTAVKVSFSANNPTEFKILDRLTDQDSKITPDNWQVRVYVRK